MYKLINLRDYLIYKELLMQNSFHPINFNLKAIKILKLEINIKILILLISLYD